MASEVVIFNWIDWPDKTTHNAGMAKMMLPNFKYPQMDLEINPMPFDGKRIIFGGFVQVADMKA